LELKALIEITRPHNCLMGGLTCVIGVLAADRVFSLSLATLAPATFLSSLITLFPSKIVEILILTYLTYVFIAAAGNIINDIYDVEVDKVNKPNRPLPRGGLTLGQAKALTVILWFTGGILAFATSLIAGIMAMIFAALGYLYAAKVKALGAVGNFAVASSFSFGLFYGAIVATESRHYFELLGGNSLLFLPQVIWVYFLTSSFVLFGREVIKGIEDLRGDKLRSVRTIASIHGAKTASKAAAISNICGMVFFNLSWVLDQMKLVMLPLVILGSLAVLGSSVTILKSYTIPKQQKRASLLDKIGGFCGLGEFLLVNILYSYI
jgi:geranylgeranylglycerol-phosphate geranylgeranyltransferase